MVLDEDRRYVRVIEHPHKDKIVLPLAVWYENLDENSNMRKLLQDQVGLEGATWKMFWKSDGDSYCLPGRSTSARVTFYEVVTDKSVQQTRNNKLGTYKLTPKSYQTAMKYFKEPLFRTVLDMSSICFRGDP